MKPDPAQHLGGDPHGVDGGLGGVQLGDRRRFADRAALVFQPGGLVHQVVGVLDGHCQVAELERHPLEATDRATEGVAFLGVLDGDLEAARAHPNASAEIAIRPSSRIVRKLRKPWPGWPSR